MCLVHLCIVFPKISNENGTVQNNLKFTKYPFTVFGTIHRRVIKHNGLLSFYKIYFKTAEKSFELIKSFLVKCHISYFKVFNSRKTISGETDGRNEFKVRLGSVQCLSDFL